MLADNIWFVSAAGDVMAAGTYLIQQDSQDLHERISAAESVIYAPQG
jgi:hypothetical protein